MWPPLLDEKMLDVFIAAEENGRNSKDSQYWAEATKEVNHQISQNFPHLLPDRDAASVANRLKRLRRSPPASLPHNEFDQSIHFVYDNMAAQLDYVSAENVWYEVCSWLGVVLVMPPDIMSWCDCFNDVALNRMAKKGFFLVWHTVLWSLWRVRNNVIFNGVVKKKKVVS
ncbi:unnamed protein product [Trifolium pratense]|uniref:Uncharacterized protein n=1 Tax=Trifolium pratense TaxID=57577 RepID=A0ACB0MCS1_TRIPR|nr:unnamed protein product [Trifolium pratense]